MPQSGALPTTHPDPETALHTQQQLQSNPVRFLEKVLGKMQNAESKVWTGIENTEWRWLVEALNHVTAVIPQIITPFSQAVNVEWWICWSVYPDGFDY